MKVPECLGLKRRAWRCIALSVKRHLCSISRDLKRATTGDADECRSTILSSLTRCGRAGGALRFHHLQRSRGALSLPGAEFGRLDGLPHEGGLLAVMTTFQTDDAAFDRWQYRRDPTHMVFYRDTTFREIARRRGWGCEIPYSNVVFLRKSFLR
jgi:hypothetical protein